MTSTRKWKKIIILLRFDSRMQLADLIQISITWKNLLTHTKGATERYPGHASTHPRICMLYRTMYTINLISNSSRMRMLVYPSDANYFLSQAV
ncbi:hypothetical protein CDAR_220091 [Caerostris darwini]|uniref:Uncharacterized protein n=1 Tax=Caerostris darwini TaxID=1538125 RepID=A0AAV4VI53_9ARAC|nr:hypothetical protein CDAR_220091 [Caerostris darwini]